MGHIPAPIDVIDVSQRKRQAVFSCQLSAEVFGRVTLGTVSPSYPCVLEQVTCLEFEQFGTSLAISAASVLGAIRCSDAALARCGREVKSLERRRSCSPNGKPLPFLSAIVACLKTTWLGTRSCY